MRYAVVGQGYIAQAAVLPAFAHAGKNSKLVALVSGDRTKRRELAKRYNVPAYAYEEYDSLLASGAVDERECEAMITACRRHGVKLMTAYRLHFEKATLSALQSVGDGLLGEVRLFNSSFTMTVADADNIRLGDPAIGGGTFYDIGIYCINAARHVFRAEPVEVVAMATAPRKGDSEESAAAILRFPGNRLATSCVSFGTDKTSEYRVVGTRGSLRVEPGYELSSGLQHHVTQGRRERTVRYSKRDQFAPELLGAHTPQDHQVGRASQGGLVHPEIQRRPP